MVKTRSRTTGGRLPIDYRLERTASMRGLGLTTGRGMMTRGHTSLDQAMEHLKDPWAVKWCQSYPTPRRRRTEKITHPESKKKLDSACRSRFGSSTFRVCGYMRNGKRVPLHCRGQTGYANSSISKARRRTNKTIRRRGVRRAVTAATKAASAVRRQTKARASMDRLLQNYSAKIENAAANAGARGDWELPRKARARRRNRELANLGAVPTRISRRLARR